MQPCPPLYQLMSESSSTKAIIILDYDGTLADFAPNPDVVIPDQQLISLLKCLINHENLKMAVVSGRRLGHIRELVPLKGIWLAGSYGLEMLNPDGKEINHLDYNQLRPGIEKIKPYWYDLIQGREDFYLEDKGWSIAIHANGKNKAEVDDVLKMAKLISVPEGFLLQGNFHFLELCPPQGEKGQAVKYILSEENCNQGLPIFIGDDDKDEDAFKEILKHDGLGIVVTQDEIISSANYFLPNPIKVREWLEEILNNL
ncbi:MAG: trehalose-phosphatase [Anaerolineaceae bacterium]|nr:trehalose-phosphatase [Anaerolineaceae bacterium]